MFNLFSFDFVHILQEATNLFGLAKKPEEVKADKAKMADEEYKAPEKRQAGRPHNVGWLDLLGDEEMTGGFASDPEDEVYESDNWREVIAKRQRIGGRQ